MDPTVSLKITTVYLDYDPFGQVTMFYCHSCRYPLLQYSGEIVTLLPGTQEFSPPIIIKCGNKHCGHKYALLGFIKSI